MSRSSLFHENEKRRKGIQNGKVILMGKSGCGKTSMRSILFAEGNAASTFCLGPTFGIEHTVCLFGQLTLSLWDCGGQFVFMNEYLGGQKETVFRNVQVLVYVFDLPSLDEADMEVFRTCVHSLDSYSPNAKICCLLHKSDIFSSTDERDKVVTTYTQTLCKVAGRSSMPVWSTSIFDTSMYDAWGRIIQSVVPDMAYLQRGLQKLCKVTRADYIALFEAATFLTLAYTGSRDDSSQTLFISSANELLSMVFKKFKRSCTKVGARPTEFEVRGKGTTLYGLLLTSTTYIVLVFATVEKLDPAAAVRFNVEAARPHLAAFL